MMEQLIFKDFWEVARFRSFQIAREFGYTVQDPTFLEYSVN